MRSLKITLPQSISQKNVRDLPEVREGDSHEVREGDQFKGGDPPEVREGDPA